MQNPLVEKIRTAAIKTEVKEAEGKTTLSLIIPVAMIRHFPDEEIAGLEFDSLERGKIEMRKELHALLFESLIAGLVEIEAHPDATLAINTLARSLRKSITL